MAPAFTLLSRFTLVVNRLTLRAFTHSRLMANNCWFVDRFRTQEVPFFCHLLLVPAGHGGCLRDRRSHPEGGCAYFLQWTDQITKRQCLSSDIPKSPVRLLIFHGM